MTKTAMPLRHGGSCGTVGMLYWWRWKRIEAVATPPFKKNILRFLILNEEDIRVKLKKSRIIGSKTMNRCKIFASLTNIENFFLDRDFC